MELLTLRHKALTYDDSIWEIPEFKALWERDKTSSKEIAKLELSIIYYYANFKSPYIHLDETTRLSAIIFDLKPDYQPDETLLLG